MEERCPPITKKITSYEPSMLTIYPSIFQFPIYLLNSYKYMYNHSLWYYSYSFSANRYDKLKNEKDKLEIKCETLLHQVETKVIPIYIIYRCLSIHLYHSIGKFFCCWFGNIMLILLLLLSIICSRWKSILCGKKRYPNWITAEWAIKRAWRCIKMPSKEWRRRTKNRKISSRGSWESGIRKSNYCWMSWKKARYASISFIY